MKSLDGLINTVGAEATSPPQSLPSRPTANGTASSNSLPRAGQILTGKQEHCGQRRPAQHCSF